LAVEDGAMMLRERPVTAEAVQLPPRATTGMAIGPQVVQSQPTAIVTLGMGTKVFRGLHGIGAAVRCGHGIGPYRKQRSGTPGRLLTAGTKRRLGQVRKRW